MNRFTLSIFLVSCVMIICASCDNNEPKGEEEFDKIDDISFENYPKVDGSTSARALIQMIACELLGVSYEWVAPVTSLAFYEWQVLPREEDIPEQYRDFFGQHIKTTQTHGAFMNLIEGNADIILTHRTISPDEKAHADAVGVTLIETPIALDAFVFIVNKNNPVRSLTIDQIRKNIHR